MRNVAIYGESIPVQDPLDIELARILYPRVEQRWCKYVHDSSHWEDVHDIYPEGGFKCALLWCYDEGQGWSDLTPVPPFGERDGLMFEILQDHAQRHTYRPHIVLGEGHASVAAAFGTLVFTSRARTFAKTARAFLFELEEELRIIREATQS